MNLSVAKRFRDITDIHINSLLTSQIVDAGTMEEMVFLGVELESRIRVVPFLSRFDNLEQVVFGGKHKDTREDIDRFL